MIDSDQISKYIDSKEGRIKLALAMTEHFKRHRKHPFWCDECKLGWDIVGYIHTEEECALHVVLES